MKNRLEATLHKPVRYVQDGEYQLDADTYSVDDFKTDWEALKQAFPQATLWSVCPDTDNDFVRLVIDLEDDEKQFLDICVDGAESVKQVAVSELTIVGDITPAIVDVLLDTDPAQMTTTKKKARVFYTECDIFRAKGILQEIVERCGINQEHYAVYVDGIAIY